MIKLLRYIIILVFYGEYSKIDRIRARDYILANLPNEQTLSDVDSIVSGVRDIEDFNYWNLQEYPYGGGGWTVTARRILYYLMYEEKIYRTLMCDQRILYRMFVRIIREIQDT